MQKGNIGVTTENIFPIIKKFLYSDHEIFLRELVSNAVDATQKLNTLASIGEFKGELGDLTVHVELGKDTITISDRGIGLTAEEIEKYINQIAFSGANDFLEKYKNDANAIIGHFGLGFYSAFMVAKKVEMIIFNLFGNPVTNRNTKIQLFANAIQARIISFHTCLFYRLNCLQGNFQLNDFTRRHTPYSHFGNNTFQVTYQMQLFFNQFLKIWLAEEIFHYVQAFINRLLILQRKNHPTFQQTRSHRADRSVDHID